jgi:hypothetical protein
MHKTRNDRYKQVIGITAEELAALEQGKKIGGKSTTKPSLEDYDAEASKSKKNKKEH